MSDVTDPSNADVGPVKAQRNLTEQLGRQLYASLPEGAEGVEYQLILFYPSAEMRTLVWYPGGKMDSMITPRGLSTLARQLREIMYQPRSGTWIAATFSVNSVGSMDVEYNYNEPPDWHGPWEPVWYKQDLERFPRDAVSIPEWMQRIISTV